MARNVLGEKLKSGQVAIGLANMYPAAGIIEGMCVGWDFVWVDGQHGEHSYETIMHACRTADLVGVDVVLRVPAHDCSLMGNYADLVPSAIMVPMVNTVAEASAVVRAVRFPPLGSRSFGGRRAIDLGSRDYYQDDNLLVVAQIETVESVEHVDEIIRVPGVDVVFFGPDDMKVQMGIPVNTPVLSNERLLAAMERTAEAAREAKKFCGCVVGSEQDFERVIAMGYQLVVAGGDVVFMRVMGEQRRTNLRQILARRAQTDGKSV